MLFFLFFQILRGRSALLNLKRKQGRASLGFHVINFGQMPDGLYQPGLRRKLGLIAMDALFHSYQQVTMTGGKFFQYKPYFVAS